MDWHLDQATLRTIAVRVTAGRGWPIEADDLMQIGALAAVERTTRHDPQSCALKTWQWKSAEWGMREALSVHFRRRRLAAFEPLDDHEAEYKPSFWESNRTRIEAVFAAVEQLPTEDQIFLSQVYDENIGMTELAKRRGVTPSAVSHAHAKVVDRLRELAC